MGGLIDLRGVDDWIKREIDDTYEAVFGKPAEQDEDEQDEA